MDEPDWLAERFEKNRAHLRAVAYRMLGSLGEAEDAVQEAWLRFSRSDVSGVENLGGWLTTVVARVCLDMLRSRKSRREESLSAHAVAKGALAGSQRARSTPVALALVDGKVGVVVAPRGRLSGVITFEVRGGRIVEIDVIQDPARLRRLHLAVFEG